MVSSFTLFKPMASSSSSSKPPSNSHTLDWTYDAFISFRGSDTRQSFTSHLHKRLTDKGVKAYLDSIDLDRGSIIDYTLWKAIEESMISIVVFSEDYGNSSWCLDELVKIVDCVKNKGQIVLPVFYDVDPSEVTDQTGVYKKFFIEHEKHYSKDHVKKWRNALNFVGNLSGWDVKHRERSRAKKNENEIYNERNQSKVIEEIEERVWEHVSRTLSRVDKDLVGMDFYVNKIVKDYLGDDDSLRDTRFIGICGMSGIGKTTIAWAIYRKIFMRFDARCFLEDVKGAFQNQRETGLQTQILSELHRKKEEVWNKESASLEIRRSSRRKKMLLVIDDVNDPIQLKLLLPDKNEFGEGSRVIITCEDEHILSGYGVDGIYQVESLTDKDACVLFCRKAFKQDQPPETFRKKTEEVLARAGCHPLALSVVGSVLGGKEIGAWNEAVDDDDIWKNTKKKLRLGYEGLGKNEKQIFLDIACCLNGEEIGRVERILDACGFRAKVWIKTLIQKSFLRVEKSSDDPWVSTKYATSRVQMHELLRAVGIEIVKNESPDHPGRRSRMWDYDQLAELVEYGEVGTDKVEVIVQREDVIAPPMKTGLFLQPFDLMKNLRILMLHTKICLPQLPFNYKPPIFIPYRELRVLEWIYYDGECLPNGFNPVKLVELHLCASKLKRLWYTFETFPVFNKFIRYSSDKYLPALKILNLSSNIHLIETPDFTYMPNLEELHFSDCIKLPTIHPSYQNLEKLVKLLLDGCSNLTELPTHNFHNLQSLVVFSLWRSSKIKNFPTIRGPMPKLRYFDMMETSIETVPDSITNLTGLTNLILQECSKLRSISHNIDSLKSLKVLVLNLCPIDPLLIEDICRSFNVPESCRWPLGFDIREDNENDDFGLEYGYFRINNWQLGKFLYI